MKALALSLALVALCAVQGCSRTQPADIAVKANETPIAVGEYYAPSQPADPFKHRDWFAKVNGVEKGFVQYELVTHTFIPFDHVLTSTEEEEFRLIFPNKVDRQAVEQVDKK